MNSDLSGVIVVKKEKDMTSFDVVSKIKRLLETKKVGHTGTLDPMAEGVLVVCIGQATKIVELITAYDKEYVAGVKLGIKTNTYDSTGEVLKQKEVPDNISLEEVLNHFKGTYLQEVPIYSAVKVNGKKLYEYARNHEEVELPKKEVNIYEIELLDQVKDEFHFRANVSKGCYIRSLINDIGNYLGVGAIMTSLTRTKQGNILIEDAYSLEDIQKGNYRLYSIEEVLPYPQIIVDKELEKKISNGVEIDNKWNIKDKVLLFNSNKKLLGIYEKSSKGLKTWKNFI